MKSLSTKLVALFLLVSLTPLIMNGFLIIETTRTDLEREVGDHLNALAQSRANHIKTFLTEHKKTVELLASEPIFKELLLANEKDADYKKLYQNVDNRINNLVKINGEIYKVYVMDKNGKVIVSNIKSHEGQDRSNNDYYTKGKEKTSFKHVHVADGKRGIIDIGTPIKDGNKLLGVFVAHIEMDELFSITTDVTGLGETGEIYLVDSNKQMISPSLFEENVILNKTVKTENTQKCFEKNDSTRGETLTFVNYRGTEVLGAHTLIPELNWCLLAEVDKIEALGLVDKLRNSILVIVVSMGVVVSILAFFLSRSISTPIKKLTKAIEDISMGRMDAEVECKDREDEIGALARAFDRTVVGLKIAMRRIRES